jgi:hypothetical protein
VASVLAFSAPAENNSELPSVVLDAVLALSIFISSSPISFPIFDDIFFLF